MCVCVCVASGSRCMCVCACSIWFTVVVDILMNIGLLVVLLVLGITQSVGVAVTCGAINSHYGIKGWGK